MSSALKVLKNPDQEELSVEKRSVAKPEIRKQRETRSQKKR